MQEDASPLDRAAAAARERVEKQERARLARDSEDQRLDEEAREAIDSFLSRMGAAGNPGSEAIYTGHQRYLVGRQFRLPRGTVRGWRLGTRTASQSTRDYVLLLDGRVFEAHLASSGPELQLAGELTQLGAWPSFRVEGQDFETLSASVIAGLGSLLVSHGVA